MKVTKWAWGAALAAALWGRDASAQQDEYYRDAAPRLGGAEAAISDDEGETSYASTPVVAQPTAYGVAGEEACASECDCGPCCYPLADLGEAWKIFDGCFFQERSINAGGWLAQSFTWNPYSPNDRFNGPMTWTDRSNEYQMNEFYFYFGKAANTEGCGWDFGYRADLLYGSNYRWTTAGGLETNFGMNGDFYGLALPQFYAEIAHDDITVKLGHFLSPVGYFAVGTANNFFPVLPYTFQYGEPFTHTGALATWKVNDKITWGNGFTRGWDNFDSTGNPNLGYLGTLTYTRDNGDTLAWVGTYGREPNLTGANFNPQRGVGFSSRYLQTLVYTKKFDEDTTWILQSDFGNQGEANLRNGGDARWYGINTYLLWNQTCRLQWGANFEWFRDEGGARVGAALPSFGSPNARGYPQAAGFDGSFYAVTVGPKYFFTPNMYTRAAFRADWYDGTRNLTNNMPFDDGTRTHQQLVVFDLVLTF
ncbi:MAG: outer membrane beta-barrel protein [Pirellulales bacterium]